MELNIALYENTIEDAVVITYVSPEQSTLTLPKTEALLTKKVSRVKIQLADTLEDFVSWREGKGTFFELWDEREKEVLGRIDIQGQFESLVSNLHLKTQASAEDSIPVVFEIWREGILLAQFSMPVPTEIKIKETFDEMEEVLQNPDTILEK